MEQTLQTIVRELSSASGDREKKIREASEKALILFGQASLTDVYTELKQSWAGFVQPFQLGLASRSTRVILSSLHGLQAAAYLLLSKDVDSKSKEHLTRVVDYIVGCNCPAAEVQRERIKILLALVGASPSFVHGDQLEKVFEACLEVQSSAKQTAPKTAAVAAVHQMLHLLGQQLQEYCKACYESDEGESNWTGPAVVSDYLLLLKLWTGSLQEFQSQSNRSTAAFLCEVSALESLLANTSQELVKSRIDVSSVLRDQLIPSLTSMYAYFSESAPSRLNPTAGSTTRFNRRALIHLSGISAQLVKLMGPVMFLRPALTALLHTAILSPPPEKRALVLQHCLHKIMSSLESLLALAGPTESGSSTMDSVVFGDGQLDLLNQLLTAVKECAMCGDAAASRAAVACAVALIGTLNELREGKNSISSVATRSLQALSKEILNKSPKELPLATILGVELQPTVMKEESNSGVQYISISTSTHSEQTNHERPLSNGAVALERVSSGEEQYMAESVASSADVQSHDDSSRAGSVSTSGVGSPARQDDIQVGTKGSTEVNQKSAAADKSVIEDSSIPGPQHSVSSAPGHDKPPSPISRSAGPCVDPDNAVLFMKMLTASLPSLLKLTDMEAVDGKLQQVASMFCSLSGKSATIPETVLAIKLQQPSPSNGHDCETGLSVLTADGVYVACYGVLATNLYLQKTGYYTEPLSTRQSPLSQEEFSDALGACGVLLCLSPQWVNCLYNLVLANNILATAGYHNEERHAASPTGYDSADRAIEDTQPEPSLVETLISSFPFLSSWSNPQLDGLGDKPDGVFGDLMISDSAGLVDGGGDGDDALLDNSRAPLLQFNEVQAPLSSLVDTAVRVFVCKELLQTAWPSVIASLQSPLHLQPSADTAKGAAQSGLSNASSAGPSSGGDKAAPDATVIVSCLDGLRLVARLCCRLAMQRQCGEVLAILSEAAIGKMQSQSSDSSVASKKSGGKGPGRAASPGGTQEDAVIKKRPSVLAAFRNVRKPSGGVGGSVSVAATAFEKTAVGKDGLNLSIFVGASPVSDRNHTIPTIQLSHALCLEALFNFGLQSAVDSPACWVHILKCCEYVSDLEASLFSTLRSATPPEKPVPCSYSGSAENSETGRIGSLAKLLELEDSSVSSSSPLETLSEKSMVRAITHLSFLAERLLDNAVRLLSLPSLITFLNYLCRASVDQQSAISKYGGGCGKEVVAGLHIRRFTPLLLVTCSKSQRPLLHLLRVWATVSQHLGEAACSQEREVSRVATECLHQVMSACVQQRAELPLFSFHKALLKPMENILSLGICDKETQDQIVYSLCELVEASRINIGSGWSAVFGALRSVKLEESAEEGNQNTSNPVIDIIDTVLKSDNAALISDAALDCVECLLKFLSAGHAQNSQLAQKALSGVEVCHQLFTNIHQLKSYPDFRGAAEIQDVGKEQSSVFDADKTGLLRVWFLLFRGMCDALPLCPAIVQPHLVDKLFSAIESAWRQVPGKEFAVKVLEDLLLPSLHRWLQGGISLGLKWKRTEVQSFKHCCGRLVSHACELVLPVLCQDSDKTSSDDDFCNSALEVMHSVLDLMVDCIIQPEEALASMGNASLRFLLLGNGGHLPKDLWQTACHSLNQSLRLTLQPLKMVLSQFEAHRHGLGGREDRVKITCKKNMTVSTAFRILHLAKQVFVLPSELKQLQKMSAEQTSPKDDVRAETPDKKTGHSGDVNMTIHDEGLHSTIEDSAGSSSRPTESFSFFWAVPLPSTTLFHRPPGLADSGSGKSSVKKKKVRVPFRSLTVSLVTHQLVLHTLGDVLLGEGSGEGIEQRTDQSLKYITQPAADLNPVLRQFTPHQLDALLDGVLISCQLACSFNRRPGFRLAVAKVGALEQHSPHLLRQVGTSMRIYIRCLLHLLSCKGEALEAWFSQPKPEDTGKADHKIITGGDVTSKPSINRDCSATVDLQWRDSSDSGSADSAFDRSAVLTKNPCPLSWDEQHAQESSLLKVAASSSASPAVQWLSHRVSIFIFRLVHYIRNLLHQHEVDGIEDEAQLLRERDETRSDSSSTNELISDIHIRPVCVSSQEWRSLELDMWQSLLDEVLDCVCQASDQQLRLLVPLFYSPLVSLCTAQDARLQSAVQTFFIRYGQLQGIVARPEVNGQS